MISPEAAMGIAILMTVMVVVIGFTIWALIDRQKERKRNKRWSHVAIWQGNGSLESMFHTTHCPTVDHEVLVNDLEETCGACGHEIKYRDGRNTPKDKYNEWFNEHYLSRRDVKVILMTCKAGYSGPDVQVALDFLIEQFSNRKTVDKWHNKQKE